LLRGIAIVLALVALLAAAAELYLRSRERAHWRRAETAAERELLGGGLQGLLRARALALGGASAGDDAEPAATIALASAMLASEYGLSEAEAARAAADAVETAPRASQRAHSLKLASRALVEVVSGHLDQAEALARQSVSLGHKQASPLFVLGRVRFRQGNLAAASHAFQAALVREPNFIEARVSWAEVWLEQGEPERAKENLLQALRYTPDHGRAQLLLAEVDAAAVGGKAVSVPWEATCARDEAKSSFIAGACALARAQRAARSHDGTEAVRWAEAAGRGRPLEPRVLGGAAQVLAALGEVDRASVCLQEATLIASPSLPSLRWAKVAVELGRGQLVDLADAPKVASSPWAPIFLARNALASGGIKAVSALLRGLPLDSPQIDAIAFLTKSEVNPTAAAASPADPFHTYLKGMQARLGGKTSVAADLLSTALEEHGDACRAAGEYLAARRELGRGGDDNALAWLRRENVHCVNLPALGADKSRARKGADQVSH